MPDFSSQAAAFTGFRIVREHPRFLVVWAIVALFSSILITVVLIVLGGREFVKIQQFSDIEYRSPTSILSSFRHLVPMYVVIATVAMMFYGVLLAAMNRAVLRPHDERFAYFALSGDELRQIGLLFITFAASLFCYVLIAVFLVISGTIISTITQITPTLFGFVSAVTIFLSYVLLTVRFSLAPAITFYSKKINLIDSWRMTRGKFWPIFGTYMITVALVSIILLLTYLITLAVVAVLTGKLLSDARFLDTSSIGSYFTMSRIVQTALDAGVSALIWPVLMTPSAWIYLQLAHPRTASDIQAFQ